MRYKILSSLLAIFRRYSDRNLRLRLKHRLTFRSLRLVHLHDLPRNNRAALTFLGRNFYDDARLSHLHQSKMSDNPGKQPVERRHLQPKHIALLGRLSPEGEADGDSERYDSHPPKVDFDKDG